MINKFNNKWQTISDKQMKQVKYNKLKLIQDSHIQEFNPIEDIDCYSDQNINQ